MLQLRRIRSYTKNDGKITEYDAHFEPDILINSHAELFDNIQKYVEKIPEFERYNCHYTLGDAPGGKTRGKGTFISQCLIPFDIDGIEFTDDKEQNKKIVAQFFDTFFEVTLFDPIKTVVIFSGNGLHFVVQTAVWTERDYFKKHAKAYAGLCSALEQKYRSVNLKFKELDRAVFQPNKMLRLPGTLNKKPGKIDRVCKIISGTLAEQTVDWQAFGASAPKEAKKQVMQSEQSAGAFPRADSGAIEGGCEFLKHCKENPAKVNEAQWYASLSILSRLEDGKAKCHEYSKGHPDYDPAACDEKIQQALDNSKPRTCENISTMGSWCEGCVWNGKVKSPIGIRGEDFIATEHTGFHKEEIVKDSIKLIPAYDDLRKFFSREKYYKVSEENGAIWVWDGKKYELYPHTRLRGFAGEHFFPQPMERHIVEFINRVTRLNQVSQSFFEGQPGHINFANGVLNLATHKLTSHSPDDGFIWVLPYEYDSKAVCPEFDAMMKRITCNDSDIEQLLLEVVGDAICDRSYWKQVGTILVGEGANGKSFFLDVVKMLVGTSNFSTISIKEMESPVKRHMMRGALVNLSDEMPNLKNSDTDVFKKVMGGDIIIERKYQDPITMRCSTKLMFATNELPHTQDHTWGMLRRMNLVPFDARFDKNNTDHNLRSKIERELPGIFNKILLAYETLRKRGDFLPAKRSKDLFGEYKNTNDVVGAFLEEELSWAQGPGEDPENFVTFTSIMMAVKSHAMLHNERFVSGKKVVAALNRIIPDFRKRIVRKWDKQSGKYERAYLGVSFNRQPEEPHVNGHANGKGDFGDVRELGLPGPGLGGPQSTFA